MHEMLNFTLFYFLSHNFVSHSVHRFGLLVFICSVTFGFAFYVISLNWVIELVFLATRDKIFIIAKWISFNSLKNFIAGYMHKHVNKHQTPLPPLIHKAALQIQAQLMTQDHRALLGLLPTTCFLTENIFPLILNTSAEECVAKQFCFWCLPDSDVLFLPFFTCLPPVQPALQWNITSSW